MDMGYSYPSFGFPNEPAAVPVAEDDLISELDSILGNTPPLADAEPASSAAQVAQAVPEFDYSNLSTAQIKKLVPYGQVLHLLAPEQVDQLLGENQMNPLDGRAALISAPVINCLVVCILLFLQSSSSFRRGVRGRPPARLLGRRRSGRWTAERRGDGGRRHHGPRTICAKHEAAHLLHRRGKLQEQRSALRRPFLSARVGHVELAERLVGDLLLNERRERERHILAVLRVAGVAFRLLQGLLHLIDHLRGGAGEVRHRWLFLFSSCCRSGFFVRSKRCGFYLDEKA